MRKFLLALAAALSFVIPAEAADKGAPATLDNLMSMKDTPARALSCFALVGAGFGVASSKIGDASTSIPLAANGTIGAIGGGCDYRISKTIIGLWANYDLGNVKAKIVDGGTAEIDLRNVWSMGIRGGYYIQPNTILYGSIGYTASKTEIAGLMERSLSGIVLGAGLETKILGPFWVRLSTDWHRFDREQFDTSRYDASLWTTKAALMLKF